MGDEYTSYSPPASDQIHPATIHWISDDNNNIGWIKLLYSIPVNAQAEKGHLTISCIARKDNAPDFIFQINTPHHANNAIQGHLWQLPGLTVKVETNTAYSETKMDGDLCEVSYSTKQLVSGTTIEFTLTIKEKVRL